MYYHVAALGHNESALLFVSLQALSQGGILPERQKTLCLHRDPCIFPARFLIHFVNCLSPPLSPSVMLAVNRSENLSVTDTFGTWSAVRQAWGERLQIWHWAHKHTYTHTCARRETAITGYCSGPSRKTKTNHRKKPSRKRVLLCKSENLQTKKAYLMVLLKSTMQDINSKACFLISAGLVTSSFYTQSSSVAVFTGGDHPFRSCFH